MSCIVRVVLDFASLLFSFLFLGYRRGLIGQHPPCSMSSSYLLFVVSILCSWPCFSVVYLPLHRCGDLDLGDGGFTVSWRLLKFWPARLG